MMAALLLAGPVATALHVVPRAQLPANATMFEWLSSYPDMRTTRAMWLGWVRAEC